MNPRSPLRRAWLVLGALAVSLLGSCVQIRLEPLPLADEVEHLRSTVAPPVYDWERVDQSKFPALLPVAAISTSTGTVVARDSLARQISKKAKVIGADCVLLMETQVVQTGSYTSFGAYSAFSSPTYAKATAGLACVFAPARLGVKLNGDGMVTALITDEARECGIQEGDSVLSVDGKAVEPSNQSPHLWVIAGLEPGDEVEMVWIRPGEGRMSGMMIASDNEHQLSDVKPIAAYEPRPPR